MFLAKVTGNVVSTQKNKYLTGHKLMVVKPVDLSGNFIGEDDSIAIDLVNAGVGDTVITVYEGDAVQQILGHMNAPVHTMIVGVVDDIDIPL